MFILSLMCAHSSMTRRINLIFTQKLVNNISLEHSCLIILLKTFSLKSYAILIRALTFLLGLYFTLMTA